MLFGRGEKCPYHSGVHILAQQSQWKGILVMEVHSGLNREVVSLWRFAVVSLQKCGTARNCLITEVVGL